MRSMLAGAACLAVTLPTPAATTYDVGPAQTCASIGDVPWESLSAGDTVRIHWRASAYQEKWVICGAGTAADPITVQGVPGAGGELPVISGIDATTRTALNFWSEGRGVVKVGGSSTPADVATHIVIEGLDIASGRAPYGYTDDEGNPQSYPLNAAAIYVERGSNITIRGCVLRDSGNGLFVASGGAEVLVEGCHIYGNGVEEGIYGLSESILHHNNYTEAEGITFQHNHFGPLRADCRGNNLKDRSTGLVVRYNWIESGNRQLDLVDTDFFEAHADYGTTFVYGNVLVEHDGDGNSQVVHFGGDSGATARYRGKLYFHGNTVVSTRAGNTTLLRLSTDAQECDCRNNVVYVTQPGSRLAMLDSAGVLALRRNWLKPGWVDSHSGLSGGASVTVAEANVETASPGFADEPAQVYELADGSACVDQGTALDAACLPDHDVLKEYVKHLASRDRPAVGALDIGAYEWTGSNSPPVLDPVGDRAVEAGDTLAFTLTASDPDAGDALAFSKDEGPVGTLVGAGFSYAPSYLDEGTHQATFTVTDDGAPPLSDGETITITVTMTSPDTDSDGVPDPWDEDDDDDGLLDVDESGYSCDPLDPDSDGDGMLDGLEVLRDLDPAEGDENGNLLPDGGDDFDGDGWTNLEELEAGTDPLDPASHPPDGGWGCGAGGAAPSGLAALLLFAFALRRGAAR